MGPGFLEKKPSAGSRRRSKRRSPTNSLLTAAGARTWADLNAYQLGLTAASRALWPKVDTSRLLEGVHDVRSLLPTRNDGRRTVKLYVSVDDGKTFSDTEHKFTFHAKEMVVQGWLVLAGCAATYLLSRAPLRVCLGRHIPLLWTHPWRDPAEHLRSGHARWKCPWRCCGSFRYPTSSPRHQEPSRTCTPSQTRDSSGSSACCELPVVPNAKSRQCWPRRCCWRWNWSWNWSWCWCWCWCWCWKWRSPGRQQSAAYNHADPPQG